MTTIRPRHVVQAALEVFDLRLDELLGCSRSRKFSVPRQMAMAIAQKHAQSLTKVGQIFRRDHTTIVHARRAHEGRMDDQDYKLTALYCENLAAIIARQDAARLVHRIDHEEAIGRLMQHAK